MLLNARWPLDWLGQVRGTVAPISREIDLPHLGVLLPASYQSLAVALLTVIAVVLVLFLAWRLRGQAMRPSIAVLVIGGVLASPHALPADLVLVGLGLAIWGQATWLEWLVLSAGALIAALTPAPVPTLVGLMIFAWLLARLSVWRPSPAPARVSTR